MKISVVIPTKNRAQELIECIKSVIAQSLPPDELIIVDASDTEEPYLRIREEFHQEEFKYIHAKLNTTSADHQRNIGVRNSSGDIIFFLDDDVVLDKDFIKEIVKVFEKDVEKKIGGVMGNIVNTPRPKKFKTLLLYSVRRIFLLPVSGTGRFRSSGCPTFAHGGKEIKNVEFLSGGLTAYRKEVFKDLKFDEDFPNAMFTDDEDFSYRVSRKYQNVYTPYARVTHNPSPIGRVNHRTRARMTIEARYYMLMKNFPRTLKYTLAFWWSVIGYFIQAIMTMDRQNIRGVISGITNIKQVACTYFR
jgi:GT2 family glycosyltransferase